VTDLIDYQGFCGFGVPAVQEKGLHSTAHEPFQRIEVTAVLSRLQDGWTPFVLDARLPEESSICSLPFVDIICPHRKVSEIASQLPKVGGKIGTRSLVLHANWRFLDLAGPRYSRSLQGGREKRQGVRETRGTWFHKIV
jgi:hypothetical protein